MLDTYGIEIGACSSDSVLISNWRWLIEVTSKASSAVDFVGPLALSVLDARTQLHRQNTSRTARMSVDSQLSI
jgi:hypothetical protein